MQNGDVCVILSHPYKLYINELCTLKYCCGKSDFVPEWEVEICKTGERQILFESELRVITYFNFIKNTAQVNINDTPVIVGNA